MPGALHMLRRTSRIQRCFLSVLAANAMLLLLGLAVAPATLRSIDGYSALLGALAMQGVLALLALVGPTSFENYPGMMGISLGVGALFAAIYLGFLARDFAGVPWGPDDGPLTLYSLFVVVALLAGAMASTRSQRLRDGVVAAVWALVIGTALWSLSVLLLNYALWGSPHWYQFWLQDGAVDDFHASGSHNLSAFLLQDVQGALFFHQVLSHQVLSHQVLSHQVLSAVGGVGAGFVGSAGALGVASCWHRLHRRASRQA